MWNNGSISFNFTFNLVILFIIFYSAYKYSYKSSLSNSVSGFFALVILLLILPLDNVFFLFDIFKQMIRTNLHIQELQWVNLLLFSIFLLIFLFLFFLFKLCLRGLLFIIKFKKIEYYNVSISQKIMFGLNLIKLALISFYMINIITIQIPSLYTKGLTTFIVKLPVLNSSYDDYLKDIKNEKEDEEKLNAFIDVFTTHSINQDTTELSNQINNMEDVFIKNIYPQLPVNLKASIDTSDPNLFYNLVSHDDVYQKVFKNEINKNLFQSFFDRSKKQEVFDFIEENKQLIIWLEGNEGMEAQIKYYKENYSSLIKNKDSDHKRMIIELDEKYDRYLFMRNYVIQKAQDQGVVLSKDANLDNELLEYLSNDTFMRDLLKVYMKDYQKGKFNHLYRHEQYNDVYLLSKMYLKNKEPLEGNPYSKMIQVLIADNHSFSDYLKNENTYDLFFLTDKNVYYVSDMLLYQDRENLKDLINRIQELNSNQMYSSVDSLIVNNFYGYDESYIEQRYDEEVLTYDSLKVLLEEKNLFSEHFRENLFNWMK